MDLVQRQDKLQPSSSGEVGIYPSGQGYLNGFNDPGELKLFQLKNALNNKMSRAFDDSSPPSTILNGSDSSHLSAEIVQAETADDDMNQADVIEGLEVPRYQALIGSTPLVDISSLATPKVPGVRIFAKCEFMNPGFSMKDRIVRNIFDKAEDTGKLSPGGTVVAASSGNTGAAVAMIAAMRGYNAVITTSPKCSAEKMNSIKAYGAKLAVSPSGVSEDHPESYMNMAKTMAKDNPAWFDVDQYDNLDNPEAHFKTLGPEIWNQTHGTVTHFVAGGSTGGTISGTGRFLKGKNPDVKCVLADPHGSIFTDYFRTRTHGSPEKFLVEGVGKGSIPGAMNFDVIDSVIQVNDKDAFQTCHELARREGLMVGGSAGLNVFAAVELANSMKRPAVIVTVLCDLGIKYLTKVYNPEWLKENGIPLSLD